jgi:predicted nucleic acid-binding protein
VTSRRKRLYWDSCNFISLISEDEAKRADVCERILEDAEKGLVQIVTSALTIAEVVRPKGGPAFTAEKAEKIEAFFYHEYILVYDVTRGVAEDARNLSLRYGLKPRDAIHLATALSAGVEALQTWNRKDFRPAEDAGIGIEEPKWTGTPQFPLMDT